MNTKNFIYEVIIEIPKNSSVKYEYDKERNRILVDRFLFGTNIYPGDYGFLENTLELDGDPLDVLVWVSQPTIPGCVMSTKIIGALKMIDDGELDNKLIAVCIGDPLFQEISHYKQLPQIAMKKIVDFFMNYKNLENKKTEILNWYAPHEANQIVLEAQQRYQKYLPLIQNKKTAELKIILDKEFKKKH